VRKRVPENRFFLAMIVRDQPQLEESCHSARTYPDQPEERISPDLQPACYSCVTGIGLLFLLHRSSNRIISAWRPGDSVSLPSIAEELCQEFGRLAEATALQIGFAQFPSHPGIRFPENGRVSCAHLDLCLGRAASN